MSFILLHQAVKGNPAVLVNTDRIDAAFKDNTYNDTLIWIGANNLHVIETVAELLDYMDDGV